MAINSKTSGVRLLLSLAICFSATTLYSAAQELPKMGEPVDQQLSPHEERKIGKEFMHQAKLSLPVIADAELNEYIQLLGERLLAGVDAPDYAFTFFLLNDNAINAFAVPGGYIAINSGLINTFKTEGQVASVVAHEIAHVTQRHHARAYSNQGNSGLTTAAAIIAAILIGQQSPEAGQAALVAGIGLTQQSQINYTRANEYEADRIGIDILMKAGFASINMAEAFNILNKNNSLNTGGLQLEYLRTHPLSENRVAEARSRADLEKDLGQTNSLDFKLFRVRLNVLTSTDLVRLRASLSAQVLSTGTANHILYGLALIDALNGKNSSAAQYLARLSDEAKHEYFVQSLNAKIEYLTGDEAKAVNSMKDLIALHPSRFSAVSQLADLLAGSDKLIESYNILTQYIRSEPNANTKVYKQLADIQQKRGYRNGSHEFLATYYEKSGSRRKAIQQLEIALRNIESGSHEDLRIRAKLKQLKH